MQTRTRRRRAGAGSVFHRKSDGRWVAQITAGPRGAQVARRRVGRTKAEALELLAELLAAEVDPFGLRRAETPTLGEYLGSWLAAAKATLKASTYRVYEIVARVQLTPILGDVPLADLSPRHVEALTRELNAKGMAPKSVRNVLGTLSAALAEAERLELVTRNVARGAKRPRLELRDHAALTPADARAILAAAAGDRLEAFYVLALATGMRRAELLGLSWADVDREAGTIRVRYALAYVNGQYGLVDVKTAKSRRTVALPAFALDALNRHRVAQLAERLAAGTETEDGLVFVTPEGLPISDGQAARAWKAIADRAGVAITFHGLRHGQASLLVALGVHAKTVSDRLGHSNIGITMDRYAHTASSSDRAAADLLDKAVNS